MGVGTFQRAKRRQEDGKETNPPEERASNANEGDAPNEGREERVLAPKRTYQPRKSKKG